MILFFAGTEPKDYRIIAKLGGAKSILQSFYSLGCGKNPPSNNEFDNYLLDSGGFSARQHGVDIDVKTYADYLNKYQVKFAFNLDVIDNHKSLENQRYLEQHTKTYIMPVYHGNEWLKKEWDGLLDYYIEYYPYIALGGMAGKENGKANLPKFLNYVFSKTKDKTMVHGLGMTSKPFLNQYPFFSVDSTSWFAVARFANSKLYSEKMAKVNARTRKWSENIANELPYWFKLEKDTTKLWKSRGIEWGEFNYEQFMARRGNNIPTFNEWKEKNGR